MEKEEEEHLFNKEVQGNSFSSGLLWYCRVSIQVRVLSDLGILPLLIVGETAFYLWVSAGAVATP